MPTQVPGAVPLVFQLPSPEVVFVGLPASATCHNGGPLERPRLVTSPADNSAFVVASRRNDLAAQNMADTSRYTVAAPRPGFMLGLSADGEVYEYKTSAP